MNYTDMGSMREKRPSKLLIFAFSMTVHVLVLQLLLDYLANDLALWEQELAKKRSQYAAFKDEFLSNPVCHFIFRLDCWYLDFNF